MSMSPKEVEFFTRFLKEMGELNKSDKKQRQGVGAYVEQLAEDMPNHIALYFQDNSWTWKAMNEESNKISNYFLNLGVNPGETIALMLENSPEYLFLATGINKIQGISALINFNQKKQALTHAINTANPKYIVVDGDCLPSFYEIVEKLPYTNDQILVTNNKSDIPHDFMDMPEEIKTVSKTNPKTTFNSILKETAFYIYTSGTTGLPKAVNMQNFKFIGTGLLIGLSFSQLTSDDILYIPTPLYHNLSIGTSWISAIVAGAGTALRKRFSASKFWEDIKKYSVTCVMYVGELPRYLLNQPKSELEKTVRLNKLVGLGLRKDIWERFKARFQIDHILEFYGSTEGHRGFYNVDEVPGMVGRNVVPGIALVKCDPETGEIFRNEKGFCIKCEPGDTGMAIMKVEKEGLFTGYKNKEKTEEKLICNVFRKNDTYFNTGDLFKLYEDNWVSFSDRFGDTFRWKAENVSTLEVEAILNSFPSIQMSAVYGVAIPNTEGKAGMAAIKLHPSIKFELDDFSRFVFDVLPKYSIPIFIRIRDELELTGPYKIKKTNFCKEAFNIENIQDKLYFWDSKIKKYVPLNNSIYENIMEGNLRL